MRKVQLQQADGGEGVFESGVAAALNGLRQEFERQVRETNTPASPPG